MRREGGPPDGLTATAFGFVVMLGAGNFLAVRLSNLELPPFWGAALRFGLAAGLFVCVAIALGLPRPRGRLLLVNVVWGSLGIAAFYGLMYWALVRVTAGVATVVLASVPLLTLLLATAQGTERLRVRSVGGALVALAGIAWLTLGPQHVEVPFGALMVMFAAAVCVAQSIIFGKRLSANHPVMTNAVGMSVGAVLLLGVSAVVGEPWSLPAEAEARWAVGYLVAFGSGGLFVLMLLVVRRWTASATSYMFVLFPVAAIALEAVLLDEPVTAQAALGAALVMLGVWVGALSPRARGPAAPSPPPDGPPLPEARQT